MKIIFGIKKLTFVNFLRFLMWLLCFCSIMSGTLRAQSSTGLRLSAVVTPAQCQADGIITCTLSDTAGEHLEQIKYYYIPLTGIDSITETSLSEITHLRPGKYKVKVTAVKPTGLSQGQAYHIVSDSIDEIVVTSTYEIPIFGGLYNIFSFEAPFGIVPSHFCQPTGKIQLSIQKGIFPYTVSVWKIENDDTIYYKSVVFDTCMYSGTDKSKYDYHNYYTIDSLEVGEYRIICHDRCEYYMPAIKITVPEVIHNTQSQYHLIGNSSSIFESHNIIKFKELYLNQLLEPETANDDYYIYFNREQSMYEYRFINPMVCGEKDTTDWLDVPIVTNTAQEVIYYDTIADMENYGQIWGKDIQLQIRRLPCKDTVFTFSYYVNTPPSLLQYCSGTLDTQIYRPPLYDSCGERTNYLYQEKHWKDIIFCHKINKCGPDPDADILCCLPDKYCAANQMDWMFYKKTHFYYTFPILYRIFNLSKDTIIKIDTIKQYDYLWKLTYPINRNLHGDSLLVEFVDFLDCPYYSQIVVFDSSKKTTSTGGKYFQTQWLSVSLDSNLYCPDNKKMISVYQKYGSDLYTKKGEFIKSSMMGDSIRLISNPRGDAYNFTAVYRGNRQWQMIKDNLSNTATIRYGLYRIKKYDRPYPGFIYEDYDLPNGLYLWAVYSHCTNKWDTIKCQTDFCDVPVITEEPSYKFINQCAELDIVPISGQYSNNGTEIKTYFQISHDTFHYSPDFTVLRDDTLRVGVPGTYTLSMYTLPRNNANLLPQNPCFRHDTTFTWNNETIRFDYLYAYVCNAGDTTGIVHAKGKNGMSPYLYTLFDAPNGQGTVIAQNQSGKFENIPAFVGKNMSIEMSDACEAHFITNFTVSDMEHTGKGWAEDNRNKLSLCEGAICHFYGLSLGDVTYRWTGPDGFVSESQNPTLFIPRGSKNSGTFYIAIEGSGCSTLRDSIQLSILEAPRVTIARDTAVCTGQEVEITTMATGIGDINYKMLRQNYLDRDTFCFLQRASGNRDTVIEPVFCNHTLYSIIEISDDRCHYSIPDDTVQVDLLEQTSYTATITHNDTICKGETAVLQANSSSPAPYQIQWYRDSLRQYLIRKDSVKTINDVAYYTLPDIQKDTTLFATTVIREGCPYHSAGIYDVVRMNTTSKSVHTDENILFYDSGGPDSSYANNENYQLTFYSQNALTPLQIQFFYYIGNDSLQQDSIDCLYLFDGETVSENPDFILRGRTQDMAFTTFTAESGYLTCWFISHHANVSNNNPRSYVGWKALVSTYPKVQSVSAILKPPLNVELTVDSVSENTILRAIVQGGSGDYHYQWEQSVDSLTWIDREDTAEAVVINMQNTDTRYYRVRVSDRQGLACETTSVVCKLKMPFINLRIHYQLLPDTICPENQELSLRIVNDGKIPATDIQLVQRVQYHDSIQEDTLSVHLLAANDSLLITRTLPVYPKDSAYSILLQAQIAACLQNNEPASVIFGDWNWEGVPRQQDEDQMFLTVQSLPRDTIFANLYQGQIFSYRDSTTSPLGLGQYNLRWVFGNPYGCDSLIIVMLTVSPLPPCPTVTDYEGYQYTSVRIGSLCWTQQNLRSRFYSDGRPVPHPMVYHANIFPNVVENETVFGLLYYWQAAMDTLIDTTASGRIQGICPEGWYLPTTDDYAQLLSYGASALRVPEYWINHSGGNNSTGFSALPAGFYNGMTRKFENLLGETRFWSSSPNNNSNLIYTMQMTYYCGEGLIIRDNDRNGYSVRCVQE